MGILWSDIHSLLGVAGVPLTYEMVQEAVKLRAGETQQLDWKQGSPTDPEEVAKDIACFANAQGGLLVYGVTEDRETGKAESIATIPITDPEVRRVRSAFMGRIHPAVQTVVVEGLPGPNIDNEGLLVVEVQPSRQSPHLVGQPTGRLGAPYRSGTQTIWMQEWELARAYSDRFRHALGVEDGLREHVDRLATMLDLSIGPWLVAVGTPNDPPARVGPPPGRAEATAAVGEAGRIRRTFSPAQARWWETLPDPMSSSVLNPRVGLRRWIVQEHMCGDPSERAQRNHIELHSDGTVVYAVVADHRHFPIAGKLTVPYALANGVAADFVALVEAHNHRAGATSQVSFRLDVVRKPSEQPLAMVQPVHPRSSHFEQPSWSRDVHAFQAVTGVLGRGSDPGALKAQADDLARDLTTQFGME